MSIAKDKTRMQIVIPLTTKQRLTVLAKQSGRSCNNLINLIFNEYLNSIEATSFRSAARFGQDGIHTEQISSEVLNKIESADADNNSL